MAWTSPHIQLPYCLVLRVLAAMAAVVTIQPLSLLLAVAAWQVAFMAVVGLVVAAAVSAATLPEVA